MKNPKARAETERYYSTKMEEKMAAKSRRLISVWVDIDGRRYQLEEVVSTDANVAAATHSIFNHIIKNISQHYAPKNFLSERLISLAKALEDGSTMGPSREEVASTLRGWANMEAPRGKN